MWRYLEEGRLEKLGNEKLGNYISHMRRISLGLRDFVRDDLGEAQFLNFATSRFKSVEFSIVSALGAEPSGGRLQTMPVPKRIFDPLLWVMGKR
jgi:signal transduction histidine kinase